jgi:CHAD domain-containing protein
MGQTKYLYRILSVIINPDELEKHSRKNMGYNSRFSLPSGDDIPKSVSLLEDLYSIKKGEETSETISFYDTFDWRLFNKSLVLYQAGDMLCLRQLTRNNNIYSIRITSMPVFIRDLPQSRLREHIAPITETRALLKLFEMQSLSTSYSLLNQDEKTVLRLVHEEIRSLTGKHRAAPMNYLWIKPIRGYPEHARKIAGRLKDTGLEASDKDDIYFKGLKAAGKKPGDYSTKIDIQLNPDTPSDKATKSILSSLLGVIRTNEAEIEKDLDTEFVHDFRVAVRRTRSALSQIKYVFSSKVTARFKKDFSSVGKLSNELRDLDVYLLKEDEYKSKIPPALRDHINPLFEYLREKRSNAFQTFVQGLKSPQYAKIIKDWEAFLNRPRPASADAENAGVPVIDLARHRIHKKYRSVIKAGHRILKNNDDKKLHVLRIQCKKLRYLMEFFSSLFPPKKIKTLIAQLKKLQDNLGEFNDLRVQEEYLLNISLELPLTNGRLNNTLMAIGSLIGALERERDMLKASSAKTFTHFTSPANERLFKELFAAERQKTFYENTGNIQQ